MKKIFSIAISLCFMFNILFITLAVSTQQSQDIMGRFVYSTDVNVVQAVSKTDEYIARVGGLTVKVKLKSPNTGLSLIVRLVDKSEEEAHAWFSECTKALSDSKLFLYIYFIDQTGEKVKLKDPAQVVVTANSIGDKSIVHTLSTTGELAQLSSKVTDNDIGFTISEEGYIVISQNNVPAFILGDVNDDGLINSADAVVILRYAAEMLSLSDSQMLAGDTNRDGQVNTADAVVILKYVAEMISEF